MGALFLILVSYSTGAFYYMYVSYKNGAMFPRQVSNSIGVCFHKCVSYIFDFSQGALATWVYCFKGLLATVLVLSITCTLPIRTVLCLTDKLATPSVSALKRLLNETQCFPSQVR